MGLDKMRTGFLSNGEMAALYDSNFYIKSIYYPYLGQQYNQSLNGMFKVGVWKDGYFEWLESWDKTISMNGLSITMKANKEDTSIEFKDVISMSHPAIIRKVKINGKGLYRIIFYNDFRLNGNEVGDTALYDPITDSLIHYKQNTWFIISSSQQLYEYTTGRRDQGTVINDCNDGILSKNPISQGSVDSAFSIASMEFFVYIIAGNSYNDIVKKLNIIKSKGSVQMERDTRYWKDIIDPFGNKLAKQSVAIIIGHIGKNGEIPASLDTSILKFNLDTYAYVWPRDASLTALSLDIAGYYSFTNKYYDFLFNRLFNDEGYLYQKYNSDGTYGSTWHPWTVKTKQSLNIQEDETATSLFSYYNHFIITKDYSSLRDYYDTIEKAADFLVNFTDEKLKLPLMSYDLWEEKLGVHTYTVSSVIAGLRSASSLARFLGDWNNEEKWGRIAKDMTKSLKEYMFDKERKTYYKSIVIDNGKVIDYDKPIESSILGLSLFDVLDANDETLMSSIEKIKEKLWVKTTGGLARYENDYYQRVQEDYNDIPGNPWIITTMWLAQHYIKSNNLEEAAKLIKWVEGISTPTGLIPEQINPFDGSPLSVTPLLWSHAEFLKTYIYLSSKNKDI
ncbi:glycoside hydrolase family 15 protein [Caldisphaera sp.]|uniref:glycoside hydrolase family 15 protein n=1 Tax=Caldisphaera sp. TaxID=2060322 RepID=UPI003D0DB9FB